MTEIRYRANVAAILRNARGQILICERLNVPGAWQFPQGGIDDGETDERALERELWEEIGVTASDYRVVTRKGPYRYIFGQGREKKGFHGKEQYYFLCDFTAADETINVATEHPEFRAWRWIAPAEFQIAWLPEMKQAVYRRVLAEFFKVKI
jgi:putative (di)nucleoside polyphosphate hydrolase